MSTMIQVRRVPEEIHREVKVRAALLGMSMSEYVLAQIKKALERPPREEILKRLAHEKPLDLDPAPAAILRAERERR